LLLAPACATSSKTGKPASAPASQKRFASKAKSSSDSKKNAKAQSADSAKAAPAEAKKPEPPPEPDLPSRLPHSLYCPTPSEVPADTELTIRCAVKPVLATRSVVVSYRPSGTEQFSTKDATHSPKGWYVVTIKASEVRGSSLQFYVQAYNGNNKMVASSGTDESPNILLIRKASSGATGAGEADQPMADEDPLARIQKERDAESGRSNEVHRRPPGNVWVALGMGSGYGWYPSRTAEVYPSKATGWATGGILHLLPELGYQWTDHLAFSVQGRLQFVYTQTGSGNFGYGTPKTFAWAVLGRAYLFSNRIFGPASNLQLFGTGTLGYGTAFRLYVAPNPYASGTVKFVDSDTVSGGPIAVGLGGGLAYHFTNTLAFAAELRALAGVWNFATVIEAGGSLQWAFWSPGSRRAAAAEAAPEIAPEAEFTPPE
jgi:hypothetical protein